MSLKNWLENIEKDVKDFVIDDVPKVFHRKLGWKRDLPDIRDKKFTIVNSIALPESVDLRSKCPPIYDQLSIGSCTSQASASAFEFELLKQGLTDFMPSRLFIYYNERVIEGTVSTDSGAQVRDSIKTLNQSGVCSETMWGYDVNQFATLPLQECYTEAKRNLVTSYLKLDNTDVNQLKQCLAQGYPFIFGFSVYESFESDIVAQTGIMTMPLDNDQILGGHCVFACGWKQINGKEYFIIRNSWGSNWGDTGYFYMPTEYITNPDLASDFWTIRLEN